MMARPVHFPLLRISSQLLSSDQNLNYGDIDGAIEKIMLFLTSDYRCSWLLLSIVKHEL